MLAAAFLPGLSSVRAGGAEVSLEEVRKAAAEIERFLEGRMTDPETGAVLVNAVSDRPVVAEARNRDALSEMCGQLMELALLRGDRMLFERQFRLARDGFQGGRAGFLAWKIAVDPVRRADTSATLDDWRVVWACREASRRWGDAGVAAFGLALARSLVEGTGGAEVPPPAFNLGDGSAGAGAVPLCYLHLPAMQAYAEEVPGCGTLLSNSLAILAAIPSPPGILPGRWDPVTRKYSGGVADEVLALITLLYVQAVDPANERLRDAVELRARHFREFGILPQAYDAESGAALAVPAGASVYALWARLMAGEGRIAEAGMAVRKMLTFQEGPDSAFAGAIGGYPVFSFDQAEALLALEAYARAISSREAAGEPSPGS